MKKKKIENPALAEMDFQYKGVGIEYNSSCVGECYDDDYCRCSRITEERAREVDAKVLTKEVHKILFNDREESSLGIEDQDTMDLYAMSIILMASKAFDPDSYEVYTCGGYYGEEIDRVSLDKGVASEIERKVGEFKKLKTLRKQVEFLLTLEYGFVLDDLKDGSWSLRPLVKEHISLGADHYAGKLETNGPDRSWCPVGAVVLERGDKFRLIDGYHRVVSASRKKQLTCLVCEKK